jgi:hypothetical protein
MPRRRRPGRCAQAAGARWKVAGRASAPSRSAGTARSASVGGTWSARPAGRAFSPLDQELHLSRSEFSPALAEAIVRLGTELAFERVPELLSFFTRVGIGEETARAMTERAGGILAELEEAELAAFEQLPASQPSAGPAEQQVSVDGSMVHLAKEGWVEVKTAAVGRIERTLGGEVHAREVSYFSRLAPAEEFRRQMELELDRRGTARAQTVCAVMDGAEWLQKLVDWLLPQAVRILDFPHAAEHLTLAAQAVFGAGTAAASEWLATWRHELRHGEPDRVIAALRALPTAEATDPVAAGATRDEVLAYLETRRAQIAYAEFAAAGYPIGSGMVESANKLVVEARLKGSGMHWARGNVNPMLALRTAVCSGRWLQLWPRIWDRLRTQPHVRDAGQVEAPLPLVESSTAKGGKPPMLGPPTPLPLENKGLVQHGRPTKYHPWRSSLTHRAH